MKKLFTIMVSASIFFSCQKSGKPDPQLDAFNTFVGRYLVCDSIKTTSNVTTTTQVLGKGKGFDRNFGIYGNLEIYSTPPVYRSYDFEGPDKIHYRGPSSETSFYTIVSMGGNKLVLRNTDATGKVLTEYFTAE